MSSGKIAQVIGPVVDVLFAAGEKLPEINNALVVYKNDERKTKIVLEVALELGDGMVRTISMESTDGLTRGTTATSVVADIVRIVRRLNDGTIGKDFNEYSRDLVLANPEDVKANYYFSILALDSKGQVLKLAEIFNAQDISFKQILQDGKEGDKARVVIITHKINKAQLENVSAELKKVSEFDLLNTFKVLGE